MKTLLPILTLLTATTLQAQEIKLHDIQRDKGGNVVGLAFEVVDAARLGYAWTVYAEVYAVRQAPNGFPFKATAQHPIATGTFLHTEPGQIHKVQFMRSRLDGGRVVQFLPMNRGGEITLTLCAMELYFDSERNRFLVDEPVPVGENRIK